jgi:hypothetical protein
MGGALVTWLTTKKINTPPLALVLISPAYAAKDAKRQKDLIQMVYMPWGEQIIRLMTGGYLGGAPKDDELEWRTPRMRTDAYVTIGAVFELVDAINLAVIESPLSSGCYRLSSELGTIYKSFSCPFPLPPIRTSAFQPDSFGQFLRRDNLP